MFDWAAMTSQVMFLFSYIHLTQVTKDLINEILINQTKLLITYALIFLLTVPKWLDSGR